MLGKRARKVSDWWGGQIMGGLGSRDDGGISAVDGG